MLGGGSHSFQANAVGDHMGHLRNTEENHRVMRFFHCKWLNCGAINRYAEAKPCVRPLAMMALGHWDLAPKPSMFGSAYKRATRLRAIWHFVYEKYISTVLYCNNV